MLVWTKYCREEDILEKNILETYSFFLLVNWLGGQNKNYRITEGYTVTYWELYNTLRLRATFLESLTGKNTVLTSWNLKGHPCLLMRSLFFFIVVSICFCDISVCHVHVFLCHFPYSKSEGTNHAILTNLFIFNRF